MSIFVIVVSTLYWDDRVELCGERRQLRWAGPDFHIIMYIALQHLCVARYAQPTTHIKICINQSWWELKSEVCMCFWLF